MLSLNRFNPNTQVFTKKVVNPDSPDELIISKTYDREPVLDFCAKMRNEVNQSGKELRLAAAIPVALFFKLMQEGKIGAPPDDGGMVAMTSDQLNKLLGDEYAHLKCMDGRL